MSPKKKQEIPQGEIIRTEYAELMRKSYIDYAMSVIVARALPDVRDGLKPVQRRTLYDMYELGTHWDKPYRKSARIVGDTMGKYHPHGDTSIYDALVVLAQDFKKGQALVDGHGNFGSIEGDGAAAMRYTEARLQKITQEVFLRDLNLNTVDFVPNFDETEKEPAVLPVRIPNLLLNGSEGIAVGMATSIPPHNLSEVVNAAKAYVKNGDLSVKQLMKYIKGPDFPTGGIIVNQDDLREIYETGVGKLRVRGKVEVEKGKNGKQYLVITEIPYTMVGAGIARFLNDVAALVENRQAPEIADISNQSSKEGIRIVLELKKGADVERLQNLLYKKTRLEDTFGVNMLAVADGRPETLPLPKILEYYLEFQIELTTRKYQTLLDKEIEKREVQEGLIKAVDVIDIIIEVLRGSKNQQQVRDCLTGGVTTEIKFKHKKSKEEAAKFSFTPRQATAILEMRLAKLIGLELEALYKENEETIAKIKRYENILNNYDAMNEVILEDLDAIEKEYGRPRRTKLDNAEEVVLEAPVEEEVELVFLLDRFGYAKTMDPGAYERGKETADAENIFIFRCMSTDKICIFTDRGNLHTVRVKDIPSRKTRDKGTPIDNLCNYNSDSERFVFAAAMNDVKRQKLVFVSSAGMIKQVEGAEFDVAKRTTAATKLSSDKDRLAFVGFSEPNEFLVLRSRDGYFIRFLLSEAPEKKKGAIGVRGIKLSAKDEVTDAYLLSSTAEFAVPVGDRSLLLNRLKLSKRDGKGTKNS